MNKNITSFFVVNFNNETVAFGSNLKELYDNFYKIERNCRNYQYYYRQFQKEPMFNHIVNEKKYLFQQLV